MKESMKQFPASGEPLAVLEDMAAAVRLVHTGLTDAAVKIQAIQRGKAVRDIKKKEEAAAAKKKGAAKKK